MQIPQLAKKLESLGLTDKEARVYVATLFLGPSPVQKIAEQAGVNRATTYVILDQLADFGLVSQSNQGKKTVFIAEEPEALDKLFDIQLRQIEARKQELKKVLPELKKSSGFKEVDAPEVRFYKGIEGIKTGTSSLLKKASTGQTIYGFSNIDEVLKIFPDKAKTSPDQRLKKNISSKIIYSYSQNTLSSDKKLNRQSKKIDTPIAADINIFKEYVSLLTYRQADPVAVVIKNREIVKALRQLFELAWYNQKNSK